jgi:hypothetical protein
LSFVEGRQAVEEGSVCQLARRVMKSRQQVCCVVADIYIYQMNKHPSWWVMGGNMGGNMGYGWKHHCWVERSRVGFVLNKWP